MHRFFWPIGIASIAWKLSYFDSKERMKAQWKMKCPATSTLIEMFGVINFTHTIWSDDTLVAMTSTIRVFLSWRRLEPEPRNALTLPSCLIFLAPLWMISWYYKTQTSYKIIAKEKSKFKVCSSVSTSGNRCDLKLSGWKCGKSTIRASFSYTNAARQHDHNPSKWSSI